MKKKATALLLALSMTFALSACGSSKPSADDITKKRKEVTETDEVSKTDETAELPSGLEIAEETDEKSSEAKKPDSIVFGSDQAAGYKGFTYLTEAIIATSDTASGNKASFSVYIPDDDYTYISGAKASSSRMGVEFEMNLSPYLQYDAEDYTLEENLQEYVESMMDYSYSNNYGVTIGEIAKNADGSASCEVSYMEYNTYTQEYSPIYVQYYLREMEDGIYALSTIKIEADETTGKTAVMLEELSSFYQMDIPFDESFAQNKREEFENSEEYNPAAINTGFMTFELPEGWGKDETESSYDSYVFAPNGDSHTADAVIIISTDWNSEDIVGALLSDKEYTKSYFEELFSDEEEGIAIQDITVEDMQETFMGKSAKISISALGSDGVEKVTMYMGQKDYDVYGIYVYTWGDESEAEEAVDKIFETGHVK